MARYRASGSQQQFRRYLEDSGVRDTVRSVLMALYKETHKPDNALDSIRLHLGAAGPEPADRGSSHRAGRWRPEMQPAHGGETG
ncbi:hypothetical protein ABVT39_027552 [Epinephelus coioides]